MYDEDMKSGIYKITNLVNGKFYIGSSSDVEYRWECHKRDLRAGTHGNLKLQHSWNFHGEDKFDFVIIEEVEPIPTLLLEREQHYFNVWKPYERMIGYNICPTAYGGDNFTHNPRKEEIREKLREMYSGENNPMFGKKHNESSLIEQKNKAKGRYTLNWFVERYGKKDGRQKFEERRMMLANRKINYSHPKNESLSFKGKTHKKDFHSKVLKSRNYFKNQWDEFVILVKSNKYSQRQLSNMLGISRVSLRHRIKQINA